MYLLAKLTHEYQPTRVTIHLTWDSKVTMHKWLQKTINEFAALFNHLFAKLSPINCPVSLLVPLNKKLCNILPFSYMQLH